MMIRIRPIARPVLVAAACAALASPAAAQIDATVTADNAYGFGFGSPTTLANDFGSVESFTAAQIFNCPVGVGPELYNVSVSLCDCGAAANVDIPDKKKGAAARE